MHSDGYREETERRAREVFEASVEDLDAETCARLSRARRAAVAESRTAAPTPWNTWVPWAAAASVATLAVILWRSAGDRVTPPPTAAAPAPEVVELLANGEGLDIASEDPEFYAWLEARDLPTAPDGAG